jgi:hypothetical protein
LAFQPPAGGSHGGVTGIDRADLNEITDCWLVFVDESLSNMIISIWTLTAANEALAD